MAYSTLPTKISEDLLTLGDYAAIKGNFEAGIPDIFAAKGDLGVGVGPDAAARLAVGSDNDMLLVDQFETTGLAWQTVPGARVYDSGGTDPPPSSWVTLTFDSERTDAETMHSTALSTSRLTIPSGGDGMYLVGGCINVDLSGKSAGGSVQGVRILLNGTETIAARHIGVVHGSLDYSLSVCTLYELSAADYVELQAYTSTDVDMLATGNYSPEFWAVWQRRSRRYL